MSHIPQTQGNAFRFPHVQLVNDLTLHAHTPREHSIFYLFALANGAALTYTDLGRTITADVATHFTHYPRRFETLSAPFRIAFALLWAMQGHGYDLQWRLDEVEMLMWNLEIERKELARVRRTREDYERVWQLQVLEERFRYYVAWMRLEEIVNRIPELSPIIVAVDVAMPGSGPNEPRQVSETGSISPLDLAGGEPDSSDDAVEVDHGSTYGETRPGSTGANNSHTAFETVPDSPHFSVDSVSSGAFPYNPPDGEDNNPETPTDSSSNAENIAPDAALFPDDTVEMLSMLSEFICVHAHEFNDDDDDRFDTSSHRSSNADDSEVGDEVDDYEYDHDGYNHRGYDRHGIDRDGYDREGYDQNGYDEDGYDYHGYDREEFDDDEFHHDDDSDAEVEESLPDEETSIFMHYRWGCGEYDGYDSDLSEL